MNLDRLHAFTVFASHLNFTRAAERLHITQPALHAQVRRLSEELGVPLYVRNGHQLSLTQQGEAVVRFGRELGEQITHFHTELTGQSDQQPVVLAAGEGSFLYLLGPAIKDFLKGAQPPLQLVTANVDDCMRALRSGRAHLGVASPDSLPTDLECQVLTRVPQVLLVPEDSRLAEKTVLDLCDLAGHSLILPPRGRRLRDTLTAALIEAEVDVQVSVEADGWELLRHFTHLGLGLAVVNGFCPPPAGFTSRPIADLPHRTYYLMRRRRAVRQATQHLEALLHHHRHDWRTP